MSTSLPALTLAQVPALVQSPMAAVIFSDARDEHLADELASAGLGESGKGNALSGIGAGVDDEHGPTARLDVLDVAERVLGTDHSNDAQGRRGPPPATRPL